MDSTGPIRQRAETGTPPAIQSVMGPRPASQNPGPRAPRPLQRLLGATKNLTGDVYRGCRAAQRRLWARLGHQAAASQYLTQHKIAKLHLGCGKHLLPGWLNTDLEPRPEAVYLDATRPFPLPDGVFDFVYTEHMIEHISFDCGARMLTQCARVLKSGGVIRVATPDLAFLIGIYNSADERYDAYIKWSTDNFIRHAPIYADTFVINNFVRQWGHLFIYDERLLRHALTSVGFTDVKRCELDESGHPALRDLSNAARMPAGFLALETLVLEGTKR